MYLHLFISGYKCICWRRGLNALAGSRRSSLNTCNRYASFSATPGFAIVFFPVMPVGYFRFQFGVWECVSPVSVPCSHSDSSFSMVQWYRLFDSLSGGTGFESSKVYTKITGEFIGGEESAWLNWRCLYDGLHHAPIIPGELTIHVLIYLQWLLSHYSIIILPQWLLSH